MMMLMLMLLPAWTVVPGPAAGGRGGVKTDADRRGEAEPRSGQLLAAKYVANWTEPPTGIEDGRMPNAPLLGNEDLGVSLGGSLPSQLQPRPPGGKIAVGTAPCNASDPMQLWAGKALTAPGTISSISNALSGSSSGSQKTAQLHLTSVRR